MDINKQLFDDVLSGKLKGTFILNNGFTVKSNRLYYTGMPDTEYVYGLKGVVSYPYSCKGTLTHYYRYHKSYQIIDFIPNMNTIEIEIPQGKEIDWKESEKQNKIVLKDDKLTYKDISEKLFENNYFYINNYGSISHRDYSAAQLCSNNAKSEHQLECILAKNKLANVALYLNNGWKPESNKPVVVLVEYVHGLDISSIVPNSVTDAGGGAVWFKSGKLARQAIDILGEETVKLALEPLGI